MSTNPLIDREIYNEGDEVVATLGQAEFNGRIRGVGTRGSVLEVWIVEVDEEDRQLLPQQYPYTSIMVPHTQLRRKE